MRRNWMLGMGTAALAALALAVPAAHGQSGGAQQPPPPKTHLKVGDVAPGFSLRDHTGKKVKLSSYRGKKNVVLAFYVLAHTGG